MVVAFAGLLAGRAPGLTAYFFVVQDCLAAAACMAMLLTLRAVPPLALPAGARAWNWKGAALLGAAVFVVTAVGTRLIYDGYALSLDEFMAVFDSAILRSGRLAAAVPETWREYVPALQPIFRLAVEGNTHWVSAYLPVNAAFRALASLAGAEALVSPMWAALATVAVYGIARRLWPEKPQAALAAAVLMATSPQVLITAMTPYAMSAHLALNLTWLWLVLCGGRFGHGAALAVAFLATGLHQLIFHPLFAAPFVLELWLARRWRAALFHTVGYAAIGLFWVLYPALLLSSLASATVAAAANGETGIVARVVSLLVRFDPLEGAGVMAMNLVRLFTWQSLLAVPLALAALPAAFRAGGMSRALVLGLALTTAAMFVLLPYQGHGWGYRYLHGFLGSICLLAALGWSRLVEKAGPAGARQHWAVFAAAAVTTVAILIPLRAWQVRSFTHPYAVAERAIQAMDADVVLVDHKGVLFGVDLVRNDPLWTHRPIVLSLSALSERQLAALCARPRVKVFGPDQARAVGIHVNLREPEPRPGTLAVDRRVPAGCGVPVGRRTAVSG